MQEKYLTIDVKLGRIGISGRLVSSFSSRLA